ncbi:hypothetical protein A3Q56_02016 [Intoshia linei]|uniref:C3H1-type domain-containing protein n=1 Tax=Intoshia linei TaxID=1819745 RepID=A0A177B9J6_9BILA|nr:hypothetical protein A3Q56_02016 [Intoshia linei]
MFGPSNYFKNIPCPYFTKFVCTRKFCHFKHEPCEYRELELLNKNNDTEQIQEILYIPTPIKILKCDSKDDKIKINKTVTKESTKKELDCVIVSQNKLRGKRKSAKNQKNQCNLLGETNNILKAKHSKIQSVGEKRNISSNIKNKIENITCNGDDTFVDKITSLKRKAKLKIKAVPVKLINIFTLDNKESNESLQNKNRLDQCKSQNQITCPGDSIPAVKTNIPNKSKKHDSIQMKYEYKYDSAESDVKIVDIVKKKGKKLTKIIEVDKIPSTKSIVAKAVKNDKTWINVIQSKKLGELTLHEQLLRRNVDIESESVLPDFSKQNEEILLLSIKPEINNSNQNFPLSIRHRSLIRIKDELLKHNGLKKTKIAKFAVNFEKAVALLGKSKISYINNLVKVLTRIRKMKKFSQLDNLIEDICTCHNADPKKTDDYDEDKIYNILNKRYVHNRNTLKSNGYPLYSEKDDSKVVIDISAVDQTKVNVFKINKTAECLRCHQSFRAYSKSDVIIIKKNSERVCLFHPGNSGYNCCGGSNTCSNSKFHIQNINKFSSLDNYVCTKTNIKKENTLKIASMDCEMLYTINGFELARLTVVGFNGKVELDTYVLPTSYIIEYNTRYSGITKEILLKCNTTFEQARNRLLSIIDQDTILIGHSLESDFISLKLIHERVIDTSIIFPRYGTHYKSALRFLASQHLHKIIQDGDSGHSSIEDSICCIDLIKYKLSKDSYSKKNI